MTHYMIENDELQVKILAKGAELTSIQAKSDNTEFLWQSDPAYWSRHAPILFPIVGKLKNDSYYYKGQRYDMTQHGFARDMDFYVVEQQAAKIRLVLDYSQETLRKYPFKFRLEVEYSLQNNQLLTRYVVTNLSDEKEMLFSVGAHPGFKVPLDDETTFEDYRLELLPETSRTFIPVTGEVLLQTDQAEKAAQSSFPLTRELFKDGVLVFETPGKTQIVLKSDRTDKAIIMDYQTLPYLGIWSTYPADAPFVCLEPWNGVADIFDASGQLSEKLGVNQLEPQGQFATEYTTTFINGVRDE
ncbi:aldose 1-epimerase family protein [Enterococcus sp. 669A]|uniref:Aldose 1-epimerase family protein n=1 Tax=Candidatus Enterococcus moelleringii TaxID=2815325 RepID=A0ABS3L8Q0_9ENTE|nr:aldose 1-epimerase family protein [Enterococcus sp. 669A]MBO1306006.1 aldose 1-epimerase family protein [Enterococcus sp. 669A]